MKIYEIATGYTSIPARVGAATEIVVEELSRCFIDKGYQTVTIDLQDKKRRDSDLEFIEIPLPDLFMKTAVNLGLMHKLKRVLYSIKLGLKLRTIKNDVPGSILHFHNQYNFLFSYFLNCFRWKNRIKTHYTLHSYIWSLPWEDIKSTIRKKYFLESFSLKKTDHIFVLNENAKQNLINQLNIKEQKITIIANGVNNSTYSMLPAGRIEHLTEQYKEKDKKILLHVGSVCERKNQFGIIKKLTPLLKRNRVKFLYAGGVIDQGYLKSIEHYSEQHNISDNIIYLGELTPGKQLNEYYNLADAFVFLSKSEAFSLVVLEALSAGLPVFLDEQMFCLHYEPFIDKGILLFKSSNMLGTIEKNLFNPEIMAGNKKMAVSNIEENFSWPNIAAKYIELFESI